MRSALCNVDAGHILPLFNARTLIYSMQRAPTDVFVWVQSQKPAVTPIVWSPIYVRDYPKWRI